MKVLWITNIPSPYRVDFFNELGKYCDLTVLYERKKADNRQWNSDENKNYKVVFLKGLKKDVDTALCFEVIKYLNKRKYRHIVVGGYSTPTGMLAIQYMRFRRIKYILNCDGGFVREEKKLNYIVKKHFISKANCYLSSGKETNKYLIHYGAKSENINIYPFTSLYNEDILDVVKNVTEKQCIRKKYNIVGERIIVFVGQMIPRKGIDILLKAATKFSREIHTYIIGGKPTQEYLNIINDELNQENIHFLDFMNKSDLYQYLQASDLFVFPTREDIWGLVVNEAMANGLPVITTNKCVAGRELVHDNGYIINADDHEELVKKIEKCIYNNELLNFFSLNSIQNIRNYTIEKMARKIFNIMKELG